MALLVLNLHIGTYRSTKVGPWGYDITIAVSITIVFGQTFFRQLAMRTVVSLRPLKRFSLPTPRYGIVSG